MIISTQKFCHFYLCINVDQKADNFLCHNLEGSKAKLRILLPTRMEEEDDAKPSMIEYRFLCDGPTTFV